MEQTPSRTSSVSSLPSLFSNFLSKRTSPSRYKVQHRHKADESIVTFPKIIRLIVTWACFAEMGISTSLTGVLLVDLKEVLGFIDENKGSIIINISLGDVVGTLSGGYLADRVKAEKLSSTMLMISALSGFWLNLSTNPWSINLCFILLGFSTSFLEIVMEVWIINLWAGYGGTITHLAYFFYGLGTLTSPFIVSGFDDESQLTGNGTFSPAIANQKKLTQVMLPYKMLAFYCLFLSCCLTVINCTGDANVDQPGVKKRSSQTDNPKVSYSIMILFFLLTQAIAGFDVGFGLLFMNFVVISPDNTITRNEGVQLMAVYWIVYTFTRIITMLLMRCVHDHELMWLHLGITGTGIIILWISYPNKIFIWISAITIGAGISPTFTLILSYFNSYIKVTGKIATVFMLADCVGEFIYPTLMDHGLNYNPFYFVYGIVFMVYTSMIYFYLIHKLLIRRQKMLEQEEINLNEK